MMRRRRKRPQTTDEARYPSLKEHLLNRRDMLTYVGASLLTGSALVGCFIGGDDDSGPGYFTVRLPEEGSEVATLSDGGACAFFVNVVAYCEDSYYELFGSSETALAACRAELAQLDYVTLAAVQGGEEPELLQQLEQQLSEVLAEVSRCEPYYSDFTVTVTLLELTA